MSLRARLFLLVGGLVAVSVGAVTGIVAASARRTFEEADRRRTTAQMAQIRHEFDRAGDDVARAVERVAASDAVQRIALEAGRPVQRTDPGALIGEAGALAAAHALDILDIVSSDGTILSSAEWPARFGYRHSWSTMGAPASPFLQLVELPQETALSLVVVRRATGTGGLSIAGGRKLNDAFLKSLTLPDGMHAWLYRSLEPETARRDLIASAAAPQNARLEPLIARVRQSGRETLETIDGPDGPELVDAIPLAGRDGAVLGVFLVGGSSRELASLISQIRWSGIGIAAAGVAIGLALTYVLASRVTRPIEALSDATRAIAAGDWNVTTEGITASGEVAALAKSFDAMTRQLVDQRDRLVQAERVAAWRELARRLAHELKNPLFPLRLTIDNLRRARSLPAAEFDEVMTESLQTLDTGLGNLNTVIGRFSDFSRMPPPEFAVVSPNTVVEQTAALFQARVQERDAIAPIRLVLDLDPDAPSIRADGEQLGRVVQNLLLNAIDAMPRGGEIRVATRASGPLFRLSVFDSGEGLTDEECKRLFTPYYTTKQHGTGLGLAIAQSVVADHHGRIWVESGAGRGTTFHIEIPVQQK